VDDLGARRVRDPELERVDHRSRRAHEHPERDPVEHDVLDLERPARPHERPQALVVAVHRGDALRLVVVRHLPRARAGRRRSLREKI
jgi:hypothetical protein